MRTMVEGSRVMTNAEERKARREERLQKEAEREVILRGIWTGLRYIGAFIGTVVWAAYLALLVQENPEWAENMCWLVGSLAVGTFLFWKADTKKS